MFRLKTKWFNKWALKNNLSDSELMDAIVDLIEDKGVSNLGGNLFKIRVSREHEGKSGGYRTLIAYKKNEVAIFLFAFAKNEKENLDRNELTALKKLAGVYTNLDIDEIKRQVELGNFISLEERDEKRT